MTRVAIISTMALSISLGEVRADFNGNDIAPECARSSEICLSWVSGMHMMHGLMVGLKRKPLYCRPAGVINSQAVQIYQTFLRNNPAKLHLPADALFVFAMQEAFPCQ